MKQKRKIKTIRAKTSTQKPAFVNCTDINTLIAEGRFHSLCVSEGYYLIGVERGYWVSIAGMFTVFRSIGLTYSRSSYFRFRAGEYAYLPSAFISALAGLLHVGYPVAYSVGVASAYSCALRYPERWVIPSDVVGASQLAA